MYYYTNTLFMIELHNITFGYSKKQGLYSNLNLRLEKNFTYGLLGKNGAGKSTLLKLMAGLVFPNSGKISVMGQNPAKKSPDFLENLFFIPEVVDTPEMDVLDFGDDYAPFYPRFDKELFLQLLNQLEVPLKNLKELSYGQRKKTWIALGIASNTNLLLLDEPTNGLDIPSKRQFRKIMASCINEDRCIIISTHQIRDLDSLIDRILILDEGELVINAGLETIAHKLSFQKFDSEEAANHCLYAESSLGGTYGLLEKNGDEKWGNIDIELFFNASIAHKKYMQNLFSSK